MTSSHHGPYDQGFTHATMAVLKRSDLAMGKRSHESASSPDWGLQLDRHEVGIASNQISNAAVNTFPVADDVKNCPLDIQELSRWQCLGTVRTGAAWLSSARMSSHVGLSPATSATLILCCQRFGWELRETASDKLEEGGDDVKSSCPL